MSKLKEIMENKEEIDYFSQLTHDYFKLCNMRIMQELRKRWGLNPDEVVDIIFSIMGRMMNESCYGVSALVSSGRVTVRELLPPTTIKIMEGLVKIGSGPCPSTRNDISKDVEDFKKFILSLTEETDLRI